jgi:hypothetical protein
LQSKFQTSIAPRSSLLYFFEALDKIMTESRPNSWGTGYGRIMDNKDAARYRTSTIVCLLILAALLRLVPHPPNFTPMIAMALFGAANLPRRSLALLLPVAAMLLGDAALELTTRLGLLSGWLALGYGFHTGMISIYAIFILISVVGLTLRNRSSVTSIASVTLLSSFLFFVLANFAVWAAGGMYPRTSEGLWQCYTAALPFFKWTISGSIFYAFVLFGTSAAAARIAPALVCRPSIAADPLVQGTDLCT